MKIKIPKRKGLEPLIELSPEESAEIDRLRSIATGSLRDYHSRALKEELIRKKCSLRSYR